MYSNNLNVCMTIILLHIILHSIQFLYLCRLHKWTHRNRTATFWCHVFDLARYADNGEYDILEIVDHLKMWYGDW